MREGASRGLAPNIEVLSLGAKNPTRHSSDLLPYLPRYRSLFADLPADLEEMELKLIKVPVTELESVTQTSVKVKGPVWYLKIQKGTLNVIIKFV